MKVAAAAWRELHEETGVEQFVRDERKTLFQIFLIAAVVSVLLSIVLANMIADPIRRLARAAHSGGAGAARPLSVAVSGSALIARGSFSSAATRRGSGRVPGFSGATKTPATVSPRA